MEAYLWIENLPVFYKAFCEVDSFELDILKISKGMDSGVSILFRGSGRGFYWLGRYYASSLTYKF